MKYFIFAEYCYYPEGGWNDYRGATATLAEAKKIGTSYITKRRAEWFHVVDITTRKVVATQENL